MTEIFLGQLCRFRGYTDKQSNVPPVLSAGEPLVVIEVEGDDVVRCARADLDGNPVMEVTDTLFLPELVPI